MICLLNEPKINNENDKNKFFYFFFHSFAYQRVKNARYYLTLYGEMWCVQILHTPHFDKCYYYGECQKLCNNTQKKRVVFLFSQPFPYLCPRFGRSRRDIYAALGKRFLL
jgi:hypothetical protein